MISIEVAVSGYTTIKLKQTDIEKIAEDYNGDYQQYIEDMEVPLYDIYLNVDHKIYSDTVITKALNKYKIDNGLNDDFSLPYKVKKESFLNTYQVPHELFNETIQKENPEQICIDKNDLKLVADIVTYDNPKYELNHIYIDDKHIVATDTKRLIVCDKKDTTISEVFIPKMFCYEYIENDEAELFIQNNNIYLYTDKRTYFYSYGADFKFPDYYRILPKNTKYKLSYKNIIDKAKIFPLERDLDYKVSLFTVNTNDGVMCINNDYILDYEFDTLEYNKTDLPVLFRSKYIDYLVMPIKLNEDDKALYKKIEKKIIYNPLL